MFPSKSLLVGGGVGLLYGLMLHAMASGILPSGFPVMSVGFLFFGPTAVGVVTVAMATGKAMSVWRAIWWPWLPVLAGAACTLALKLEGMICVVMFLPVGLLCSSVGGLIGRVAFNKGGKGMVAGFMVLPLLTPLIESRFPLPVAYKEVASDVTIRASAEAVWQHIKSVPAIQADELPNSWVHYIGFPRPVEALVDREGLGGIRQAVFARGLVFHETIDEWQPPLELGFSIRAEAVPQTALDAHVTIGGEYFDVLYGSYRIEPVDGGVRLHLRSHFRLSTRFNVYASLWTELVMQRIQQDILRVIQARAERPA